nr:MAG: ORF1 [TTV-like mini virus]
MPPFNRRRFYRNWWNYRKPRAYYRRRRFGKSIFRRKRRRRRVRRKKFFKKFHKLKKIKINQWQPQSIKRCRIEGYLCLFQAGPTRYLNNYALWKESFFPEHYPGGGGWSIQQLSLGNLYTQHKEYMNYWTKSNTRMNLCRYYGCKVTLFRETYTDYVFSWFQECPKTVNKYYYCSQHPIRLLTHNRKKVIASFESQPHKRKPYKSIWIPPPKIMKTQWFFQQQLAPYPLITFVASAISLSGMFGSSKALSNNATLFCLDTAVFASPNFQYKKPTHPTWGYTIAGTYYLYGLQNGHEIFTQNKTKDCIYLGNTMEQKRGAPMTHFNTFDKYTYAEWGNPFFWGFMTGNLKTLQSNLNPQQMYQQDKSLEASWERQNHYIFKVRYNPFHDKGQGNQVYFIPTYDETHKTWEPTKDPDIQWSDLPLWLLFWGLEDMVKRLGKCTNLDMDWVLVVKSRYLTPPQPYYIFLSYDFVHGRGPYDTEQEFMTRDDLTNWYPRFKYQRQPVSNIVQTGPAVPTGDNAKNIQAKIKYQFFFKWGGNSPPQETIFDPTNQPVTPTPNNFDISNEIIDPSTDFTEEIYPWDFRRDFLTTTATKRITESSIPDQFMFTDGKQTSTDLTFQEKTTQEKETPKTQEETLFLNLQQLQQYNQQLQQRLRSLKQLSMDL